jgi:hypothetical protein
LPILLDRTDTGSIPPACEIRRRNTSCFLTCTTPFRTCSVYTAHGQSAVEHCLHGSEQLWVRCNRSDLGRRHFEAAWRNQDCDCLRILLLVALSWISWRRCAGACDPATFPAGRASPHPPSSCEASSPPALCQHPRHRRHARPLRPGTMLLSSVSLPVIMSPDVAGLAGMYLPLRRSHCKLLPGIFGPWQDLSPEISKLYLDL